jgi:hypothetical protein
MNSVNGLVEGIKKIRLEIKFDSGNERPLQVSWNVKK